MPDQPLEFRFCYFTPRYEETVRFYQETLGCSVFRAWDRANGERGTIFRSPNAGGLIEIEAGDTTPMIAGGFYIEVEDLQLRYERLKQSGVHMHKELGVTAYGHRNFSVLDPNGIEVSFFEYAAAASASAVAET